MRIHKEGILIIFIFFVAIAVFNLLIYKTVNHVFVQSFLVVASIVFLFLVVWFFRSPHRPVEKNDQIVLCPADGQVVQVMEADEPEYFGDRRLQVSIFMSPLNVHVNRYPVSGTVVYCRYHPGKYLVAWHPKSSVLNERSAVVIRTPAGKELLVRQIAGAVARRIITYARDGMEVEQGNELGFIRFGSRVDIFLPVDMKILVKPGDRVNGNITPIARF